MYDHRTDRTVPVFITLLVVALLVMTFDVRAQGQGVVGTVRQGASRLLAPLQSAVSTVVEPIADLVDNLRDIAVLRAENEQLRARLAESQAQLAAVEQDQARLDVLERTLDLKQQLDELVPTFANVIGRVDNVDLSFRIDKGEESGVLTGHPVLDENGYVVGRVVDSWIGGAIVIPIVADEEGITVVVGDQVGTLRALIGNEDEMVLEVLENARAVTLGQRVVTSSLSISFPRALAVGEVIESAAPQGTALTARVRPFSDPRRLEVVAVIAWPPDPTSVGEPDGPEPTGGVPPGGGDEGDGAGAGNG
ncbi:MAG TPA: rod shape-determining protein MreC [Acidimicrobiia bacterium]